MVHPIIFVVVFFSSQVVQDFSHQPYVSFLGGNSNERDYRTMECELNLRRLSKKGSFGALGGLHVALGQADMAVKTHDHVFVITQKTDGISLVIVSVLNDSSQGSRWIADRFSL